MTETLHRMIFFGIFLLTITLVQWSLYKRSVKFFREFGWRQKKEKMVILIHRVLLVYFGISIFLMVLLGFDMKDIKPLIYLFLYPSIFWLITSIDIFLLLILKDIGIYVIRGLKWLQWLTGYRKRAPVSKIDGRREFLQLTSLATVGLVATPITALSYGALIASGKPLINRFDIALPRLPGGLDGLKIVQISDLHVGPFLGQGDVEAVVDIVNNVMGDVVMITGDSVSMSKRYVTKCRDGLRGLNARYGVFGVLGNHDYYSGGRDVHDALESTGVNMLVNAGEIIDTEGGRLNIVGVDDLWMGKPSFKAALRDIDDSTITVLMTHNPDTFPIAARHQIDLSLAGHTHGGQVGLRLFGNDYSFVSLATPYLKGEYSIGHAKLYVNRGIGTVGPPVRLNSPPEISVITLRSESQGKEEV